MIRLIAVAVAVLVLAGCGTTGGRLSGNQQVQMAWIEFQREQADKDREERRASIEAIADAKACGDDPTCVMVTKSYAMGAYMSDGGGSRQQQAIAPPQREPSGWEKAGAFLAGISPIVNTAANFFTAKDQAEWSAENARILWGGINGLASAPYSALEAALTRDVGAHTTITVGGNYGDTRGDVVGRDQIGGDQYQGPVAGRDVIGRDQIIARRIGSPGDDRRDSPGPIESPVIVEPPVVVVPPVIYPPPGERPVVPVDPGADDLCARFPDATWCQ